MKTQKLPRILQVSTCEVGGGAEKLALDLFHSYHKRGYQSYLAVGRKVSTPHGSTRKASSDPQVLVIPNEESRSAWARRGQQIEGDLLSTRYFTDLAKVVSILARPQRYVKNKLGIEDLDFPGTYRLLDLPPAQPDIVHAHNLHGAYFDLRALPWLSHQKPMFLSLHDAWLLSGHCAHSFQCERWKIGCGKCPDLNIYPSIRRDATAYNWSQKKQIYAGSRLYVSTPSQWLMKKVEQSILMPGVIQARCIPYGVDLTVFRPGTKSEARGRLQIAQDRAVVLLRANSVRKDQWKDYRLMLSVVDDFAKRTHGPQIVFVALGEDRPSEYLGQVELRYVPYQADVHTVVQYYQAADLYVHPARTDTFPLAVLEALACGTPVVATAVGGIPEQIVDGVTGLLTRPTDAKAMVDAILHLLEDPELCFHMGQNAAEDARVRFDHERQVDDYLNWYQEVIDSSPKT